MKTFDYARADSPEAAVAAGGRFIAGGTRRGCSNSVLYKNITTCICATRPRAMPVAEWIRTVSINTPNFYCKAMSIRN